MVHTHASSPQDDNTKRLKLAFSITAIFMIIEVISGIVSGSLILLADAGHMFTDTTALLFSLLTVRFAHRLPNAQHTFGWLRLNTIAAFVNAMALVVITVLIAWEAVQRFYHPQPISHVTMIFTAISGFIANVISFWILSHGKEKKNLNIQAAALHVLGDLFGSVGAILSALVILWTSWTSIDPILSVLVSFLILHSAWKLMKQSVNELLEGAPILVDISKLERDLFHVIPEVKDIHHVHIWQIGEKPLMTLHVHVAPSHHDHDAMLKRIQCFLEHYYQIAHTTVQMEYFPCSSGPYCRLREEKSSRENHDHN